MSQTPKNQTTKVFHIMNLKLGTKPDYDQSKWPDHKKKTYMLLCRYNTSVKACFFVITNHANLLKEVGQDNEQVFPLDHDFGFLQTLPIYRNAIVYTDMMIWTFDKIYGMTSNERVAYIQNNKDAILKIMDRYDKNKQTNGV